VPLIKIPRHYLVSQDEDSITVDVPESMLLPWKKDYEKIIQAKGILKQIVIKPGTRTPPPTPSSIKSLSFSSPRSGGIEGGAMRGLRCTS
jgi:hypothetical protein